MDANAAQTAKRQVEAPVPMGPDKKHPSPAYVGIATVGFGLYLAWQSILMSPSLLPPVIAGYSVGNWFYAQDVLFLILLLLGGLLAKKLGGIPHSKELFWAAAALLAISTGVQYACAYQETLHFAGAVSGYMLSAFRAVPILFWGEILCTMSPRSSLACIGGGYALAFAINLAVASMEPTGVYVTHAVLPLLSAVAFHTVKTDPAGSVIVKGNARVMLASFPFALLAGMGLFGFVMRLLFDFSEMRVAVPDEIATVYAGIVVPAIVMIAAIFYSREIDYTKFCRLIMPATVLIALAIAMSEAGHQSYEAFAIGCVWVFYKIFCWAVARAVAYKTEMHPITVFAIANILLNLFTYIPLFLVGLFPIEADSMVMVATIVACALLIAVFLLRDDKLENVFSREKKSFEGIIRVNREGTVEDCVNLASAEFGLTEREREIACKVLQGETNESIIGELFISKNTLRTHMHNIYDKTDTHSREELVNLLLSYQ